MVDPSILKTEAFKLVQKEFERAFKEAPDYICDICCKREYRRNVFKLDESDERYDKTLLKKCRTKNSDWICRTCKTALLKKKMPMQAQANNLELCPKLEELECLCAIELMLISQVIPFMHIVAKHKGAQQGLKGQCVLVPTDLSKIQRVLKLPRSCNKDNIVSIALKRRLSDKSSVTTQVVQPAKVNAALKKLTEINPFYKDISIADTWADVNEQSDPELWKLLTNEKTECDSDNDKEIDSDDEMQADDNMQEKKKRHSSVPFPTVLHNIDGPNVAPSQVLNIAPGEGQIPVSFTSEPDWEALCFPKLYPTGTNHFNQEREVRITVSKYLHGRFKHCDDRFSSNPQYIFHAMDWMERAALASSIHFTQRKQFQSSINVGQLTNSMNVSRMISDDQIFASFKNIRGTPQYWEGLMFDVLAKVRQFGPPTFFLTFSLLSFTGRK